MSELLEVELLAWIRYCY